jgi:hypothetical protein
VGKIVVVAVTVGENREWGFVEPRLEIRLGAERADPLRQYLW